MTKLSTYDKYMNKVRLAQRAGFSVRAILDELHGEIENIEKRCELKVVQLATSRNRYLAREARRLATEAIMTIQRISRELRDKQETAV